MNKEKRKMFGRRNLAPGGHAGVAAALVLSLLGLQGCDSPVGPVPDTEFEPDAPLNALVPSAVTSMHGAGTLGDGSPQGDGIWLQQFDFDVGIDNGVVDGVLDYTDYSVLKEDGNPARLRVSDSNAGTGILTFTQVSLTCVSFAGTGEVTNTGELVSFVAEACDNGQPGVSMDVFGIRVPDRLITHGGEYRRRDVTSDGEITAIHIGVVSF